jgi:hypothetical protein
MKKIDHQGPFIQYQTAYHTVVGIARGESKKSETNLKN